MFIKRVFLILFVYLSIQARAAESEYSPPSKSIQEVILQQYEAKGDLKALFKVWHFIFNREEDYSLKNSESVKYFQTFKKNLKMINDHNNSESTYKLGINQFTDRTPEEIRKYLNIPKDGLPVKEYRRLMGVNFDDYNDDNEKDDLPKTNKKDDPPKLDPINWMSYIGPVRNQGQCGSCWAFSVMGAVEGNWVKTQKESGFDEKPRHLSTQQLVDCNVEQAPYGGCRGGWMGTAIDNLTKNGAMWDDSYPYTAKQGACVYKAANISPVKIMSYEKIPSADKSYEVLSRGPISGCINIQDSFFSYKSGLYSPVCNFTCQHAIVIIGYGTDATLKLNYWLGRNSWGTGWGEEGNFRVKDDPANANSCLMADHRFNLRPKTGASPPPPPPPPKCTQLFENCDFQGATVDVCDNSISLQLNGKNEGIKLGKSTKVSLYSREKCYGKEIVVEKDTSCFSKENTQLVNFARSAYVNQQTPPAKCLWFFEEACHTLNKYEHCGGDIPDLTTIGWADRIGSIALGSGLSGFQVFTETNYSGLNETYTKDARGLTFYKKIQSIKLSTTPPPPPPPKCAQLFEKCDFQGKSIEICDNSISLDLKLSEGLKIGKFSKVSLYSRERCYGKEIVLDKDSTCFSKENNQLVNFAKSVYVNAQTPPAKCLWFYAEACHTQLKYEHCGGDIADLSKINWADQIGSIAMGPGIKRFLVFSEPNFEGVSEIFTKDARGLVLHKKILSVKVELA